MNQWHKRVQTGVIHLELQQPWAYFHEQANPRYLYSWLMIDYWVSGEHFLRHRLYHPRFNFTLMHAEAVPF